MSRAALDGNGDRPNLRLTKDQREKLLDALQNNGVISPRNSPSTCRALERLGLTRPTIEHWPGFGEQRVWRLTHVGRELAEMLDTYRGGPPGQQRRSRSG
jgi:hypothetical protein